MASTPSQSCEAHVPCCPPLPCRTCAHLFGEASEGERRRAEGKGTTCPAFFPKPLVLRICFLFSFCCCCCCLYRQGSAVRHIRVVNKDDGWNFKELTTKNESHIHTHTQRETHTRTHTDTHHAHIHTHHAPFFHAGWLGRRVCVEPRRPRNALCVGTDSQADAPDPHQQLRHI